MSESNNPVVQPRRSMTESMVKNMVSDEKVIGKYPYPTFRRSMSALAAIGTGNYVCVRTGAGLLGEQGGSWTTVSLPVGGGHEVFIASPFRPEPGEDPGLGGAMPYHVSLSHMARCLHERAQTVRIWIGSNEGEVLGISLDDAEPAWECIRTGLPGDAPRPRPALRRSAAYLENHIVTEIVPAALRHFIAAVRTIGYRGDIFATPNPVRVVGCGRALLFSVPAGGRSILGLTTPYAGRAPQPYAANSVEAIRIPAPLVRQMATSTGRVRVSFGSSEGIYIRVDCRGETIRKCLRHSGSYPYARSLPPLDRPADIKVDARLAAVLLRSRDERKRYIGEAWAEKISAAVRDNVLLRRSIVKILEQNRPIAPEPSTA